MDKFLSPASKIESNCLFLASPQKFDLLAFEKRGRTEEVSQVKPKEGGKFSPTPNKTP